VRTSEEIYHQVRWDARFDPARFVLGVRRRDAPPKRIPLPRFVPGGEIPWHRVLFIEADGELVWDRASGVDRFGRTEAGRVRAARLLPEPYFTPRLPHGWDPAAGGWRPAHPAAARTASHPARLRVLTWNTLWDRYDSDRIDTARRRPLLLDALAEYGADVIALQEVETALLTMLLGAPWVRERYILATDPGSGEVDDCGLLLLSRLPVREAGHHVMRPHKAVSALAVDTAGGPLTVAVTHLTSDHSPNGVDRRREELAWIRAGLDRVEGPLMLLGDFNDGRDAPDGPAAVLGLRDAWTEARGPHDRTPTFDPARNPLAAVNSLTGEANRLDRILLRGGLTAESAALLGQDPPPGGLHISDHFGVAADLTVEGTP
jgi:endonuclease/exonuclease/phosphatase family metal-dependent hydrolase/uncharacterized protein (UPF0248 family)